MSKQKRFSPQVRERANRLLLENQKHYESRWAAMVSKATKIGCSPETLRSCLKQKEIDTGRRDGFKTVDRERIKALEKQNRELRRANEILKTASVLFAQAGSTAN